MDYKDDRDYHSEFYVKSNNPEIPAIKIPGEYYCPSLVFEGDVDGDGKDEWGTLSTGMNSQWRLYSIYNYDNKTKKWRYLYDNDGERDCLLMTDLALRSSGLEIVEKRPRKGTILINYSNWYIGILDTIVAPTYTPIPED